MLSYYGTCHIFRYVKVYSYYFKQLIVIVIVILFTTHIYRLTKYTRLKQCSSLVWEMPIQYKSFHQNIQSSIQCLPSWTPASSQSASRIPESHPATRRLSTRHRWGPATLSLLDNMNHPCPGIEYLIGKIESLQTGIRAKYSGFISTKGLQASKNP